MLKKVSAFLIICILFCLTVNASEVEKPEITSAAYVLYNPQNDQVIDSKNADKKMYPASLTKMLTSLVVLDLSKDIYLETIMVKEEDIKSLYGTSSSTAGLIKDEVYTVEQLLYLLLMRSGNDAANTLASHFCGSNSTFAQLMNEKAKELGMSNSNFVNPHGLHDPEHYTTAFDLAVLADAFLDNEFLAKICSTKEITISATNKQPSRNIKTTNFLLLENSGYYFPYATGLKTGNTDEAGRCLATSAQSGDKQYISILLNCPMRWTSIGYVRSDFLESANLLKYAFENYETVKILPKGFTFGEKSAELTFNQTIKAVLKDDFYATVPINTNLDDLEVTFKLENLTKEGTISKTVKKGDKLGTATLSLNGRVLGVLDGVAQTDVKPHWWLNLWNKIDFFVYLTVSILAFIILSYIVLILRVKYIRYKRRKLKLARIERMRRLQEEFSKRQPTDYFKMD